ncbi:MAG: DUF4174 domain-containing protein [Betaproteobacteria bacterium]|nr:MAG: DUF4174 domain-containing protein [Betaproteobacteria bacterium]
MQTLTLAQSNPLSQYRWKNRPLLVFAEDADDRNTQETREALRASACELTDRDMVIGWILERGESRLGATPIDSRTANALRSHLQVREGNFAAVLVGKDGGVKARYAKAPNLEEVFSLIDGMPMRRSEMRERGLNCDTN